MSCDRVMSSARAFAAARETLLVGIMFWANYALIAMDLSREDVRLARDLGRTPGS